MSLYYMVIEYSIFKIIIIIVVLSLHSRRIYGTYDIDNNFLRLAITMKIYSVIRS